jgi:DNA-binding transcriptional regulator YiaG
MAQRCRGRRAVENSVHRPLRPTIARVPLPKTSTSWQPVALRKELMVFTQQIEASPSHECRTLRECRLHLGLTQIEFAKQLDISVETYRPLDSGRRKVAAGLLARAKAIARCARADGLLPLNTLALMIGVHVRTLWNAARAGRLKVTHDSRTTFRQLRSLSTVAEAKRFKELTYRRHCGVGATAHHLSWSDVPGDYDVRIKRLRRELSISQTQLARRIGAAHKAVVYQWESRKRCPSPVFWERLQLLIEHGHSRKTVPSQEQAAAHHDPLRRRPPRRN